MDGDHQGNAGRDCLLTYDRRQAHKMLGVDQRWFLPDQQAGESLMRVCLVQSLKEYLAPAAISHGKAVYTNPFFDSRLWPVRFSGRGGEDRNFVPGPDLVFGQGSRIVLCAANIFGQILVDNV